MRRSAQPQPQVVVSGSCQDLDPRQVLRQRDPLRDAFRAIGRRRRELLELHRDRLEVLLDRLLEQASLEALDLLAALAERPALGRRHLVRELRDFQIAMLDRVILLREQRRERGVELRELLHAHLRDVRQRHRRRIPPSVVPLALVAQTNCPRCSRLAHSHSPKPSWIRILIRLARRLAKRYA